jgi:uncharacterized protein YjbI with pentapeptide repeats
MLSTVPGSGQAVSVAMVDKRIMARASPQVPERRSKLVTHLEGDIDLVEAVVSGDLSGCQLDEPQFRECRLEHAQLTAVNWRYARFIDCVLVDCDLSGARLEECSMTRVEFRSCRASGLQAPRGRFVDVGIFDSRLDGAYFVTSQWERAELQHSDLSESDLSHARLPLSRILACDLSRADLSKTHLTGAHLTGSNLQDIRGADALRGVTISTDQIVPAAMSLFQALRISVRDET